MSAPGTDAAAGPVLAFRDVEMVYRVRGIDREVVRGVSFEIGRGESYGLVGESGCGKSTIALGIVRYLPRNGRITRGTIEVGGRDVNRARRVATCVATARARCRWCTRARAPP